MKQTREGLRRKRMIWDVMVTLAVLAVLLLGAYFLVRKWPGAMGSILVGLWAVMALLVLLSLVFIAPGRYLDRESANAEELAKTRQRVQEIQLQKRKEQLNALQSQINPHFLYNTLDTIRGLALEVGDLQVSQMVGLLSAMFKYSMDYDDAIVTVGEELNHVQSFLQIQSIRFPERFNFQTVMDCEYRHIQQIRMPKLVLQPIVENVFTHGFKGTTSGGNILVRCVADDQKFRIIIGDNGHGIRDDQVKAINRMFWENTAMESGGTGYENFGIALKNIDARIKMHFGERYGLHMVSTPGFGTEVTVSLPVQSPQNQEREGL